MAEESEHIPVMAPFLGYEVCHETSILKAIKWEPSVHISVYEHFIQYYIKYYHYSFEYKTNSGWVLMWDGSYKSLHEGDYIITGLRQISIVDAAKFDELYRILP